MRADADAREVAFAKATQGEQSDLQAVAEVSSILSRACMPSLFGLGHEIEPERHEPVRILEAVAFASVVAWYLHASDDPSQAAAIRPRCEDGEGTLQR